MKSTLKEMEELLNSMLSLENAKWFLYKDLIEKGKDSINKKLLGCYEEEKEMAITTILLIEKIQKSLNDKNTLKEIIKHNDLLIKKLEGR